MKRSVKENLVMFAVAILVVVTALVYLRTMPKEQDMRPKSPVEKVSPATTRPTNVGLEKPSVANKGKEEGKATVVVIVDLNQFLVAAKRDRDASRR